MLTAVTYSWPWMWSDQWEPEGCVIWIHLVDLLSSGSSKNFDDLHKLINSRIAGEERLAE